MVMIIKSKYCIIWREWNAKCFEDQERSIEELKKLLIQTLFHWTEACSVPKIFHHDSIFYLYVSLFAFPLYTSYVLGLCSSALFNESLIYKKK